MSKPYDHAVSSAEKFGGIPEDYLHIHKFMDASKVALPDPRHRAIFHSSFGVFVVEEVYGDVLVNTDGKTVSTRSVAEQHILEDLGFIPTLEQWFSKMPLESWMSLHIKKYEDENEDPDQDGETPPEDFQEKKTAAERIRDLTEALDKARKDHNLPEYEPEIFPDDCFPTTPVRPYPHRRNPSIWPPLGQPIWIEPFRWPNDIIVRD